MLSRWSFAIWCYAYLLALLAAQTNAETLKHVGVKGKLSCPDSADKTKNIVVKLLHETDSPDPNDVIAETTTNSDGEFVMNGTRSSSGKIHAFIELTHSCLPDLSENPDSCLPPTWKIYVPECHVTSFTSDAGLRRVFDIGTWNLKNNQNEAAEDCIIESLSMTCRSTLVVKCHDHSEAGHELHGHAGHEEKSAEDYRNHN